MIRNILFILMILLPLNYASATERSKIAIVDVQTILDNSLAMNSIKLSVENISKNLEKEFKEIEEKLKKEEADILVAKSFLSEEDFNIRILTFNNKVTAIQKDFQDKKHKLEQSHSEAVSKVNSIALAIIKDISTKNGHDIVLPNTQVLFANQNLDITQNVITKLNEQITSIDIDYK